MGHQAASALPADSPPLLVVGASARAFAQSAAAAGWAVHAADLFGDLDLRAAARTVVRVTDLASPYPESLAIAAAECPPAAWCYTGAIENHPDLIDAIARQRPLAGNDGRRVRNARDPDRLAAAVREAGLFFPDTTRTPAGLPCDGSFLVKPLASAGGRGIRPWDGRELPDEPSIWQWRLEGLPVAAALMCDGISSRLLGITRQWLGLEWCHASPFAYCGSLRGSADHPLDCIPPAIADDIARFGNVLAGRFGLVGVIGVDAIVDSKGRVWIVEVNPRPTASMELHERATGESIAAAHLRACGLPAPPRPRRPADDACQAKAVVHAPHECAIGAELVGRWLALSTEWSAADAGWPALADLPEAGQTIRARAPLMTVFARGVTPHEAWATLAARVAAVRDSLPVASTPPSVAASPPPPAARCTA